MLFPPGTKIKIKATDNMKRLADKVFEARNASNSCGLMYDFRECLLELMSEGEHGKHGKEYVNQHPITVMWIDKFSHLSRYQCLNTSRVCDAYGAIRKLRKGEDADWELI